MNPSPNRLRALLFENTSVRQSLLKNAFWMSISEGFGKAFRAVLLIYLARVLGPNEYGILNFAMSFVAIFVSFLDFGLSSIITREMASDDKAEKDFPALLVLKFLLTIGTVLIIWTGSFFITADPGMQKVIRVLTFVSAIGQFPEFFYAFWRARQRMEFEAWANIGNVSLVTIATFLVIFNWPSAEMISYGYLLCSILTLIAVSLLFYSIFLPFGVAFETAVWKKFLFMSYPLALTSIFGMLYSYVDSILMGYLGQITQTGSYHAALKIIYVILTPVSIISMSFFPVLSKFSRESPQRLQKVMNYHIGISLFLAIPIVGGGILLAPRIINFLYGPAYSASVKALEILLLMAGFSFFCNPLSNLLVANNQQGKIFWVSILGSIVNIVLNVFLIPRFSLYGAAVSSVVCYGVMLLLYLYLSKKFTPVRFLNGDLMMVASLIGVATVTMLLALSQAIVNSFHVLLTVLVGGGVYVVTLFILLQFLKHIRPNYFEHFSL